MLKYALNRIALAVPTLLIVAVIVFVLMRAIPGDPAQLMLGDLENPRALAELRRDMGLDKPVAVQFLVWLKRLAEGDLGNSIAQQRPVLEMLVSGFGVTASLVVPAVLIATLLAVPLGMLAAWKQNTIWDVIVVTGAIVFLSIPVFSDHCASVRSSPLKVTVKLLVRLFCCSFSDAQRQFVGS